MITCKCSDCIYNNPVKEKCTNTDIIITPLTIIHENTEITISYVCAQGTEDFFASVTEEEIDC